MEIEKIFSDLESNQTHESEEAKNKLVELFSQNKEQWLVHDMMDYFLKTGSLRIMEVLVKVKPPHDSHIFDRLAEWMRPHTHRIQALNLFSFIVRKHPSWLYKVEKHRLIKEMFRLLLTEKDIVPLMSALLCIITLLPLIPNLVPNFLNNLFEVFGHLASWNWQNPNRFPDDKLIHLQLGLQLLFHRLYGMFPCNFLSYLSSFIKKGNGAIFHHTIKPLLETVRMNPLLVTETVESEISSSRWKEIESHDVVFECARLSLPSTYQEFNTDITKRITPTDSVDRPSAVPAINYPNGSKDLITDRFMYQFRSAAPVRWPNYRIDCGENVGGGIWSPYNEITASGTIPLTPTPTYMLTLPTSVASNLSNHMIDATGSSPPEAAVEATPETTPLKDVRDVKAQILVTTTRVSNSPAVREIFASNPSLSPMQKDENKFNYPDITIDTSSSRNSSTYDRRLQKIIYDRSLSQSPFETIESQKAQQGYRSPTEGSSKCETPNLESELYQGNLFTRDMTPTDELAKRTRIVTTCNDCNETERSMCTAGGLHIATCTSMQLLANGIKKRQRIASYCYNDASCQKMNSDERGVDYSDDEDAASAIKVRRTKSCSAINMGNAIKLCDLGDSIDKYACKKLPTHPKDGDEPMNGNRCRLQKSGKMLAIATSPKKTTSSLVNVSSQTIEIMPQYYETSLFELLLECNNIRNEQEKKLKYPHERFDQDIMHAIRLKDSTEMGNWHEQEQFQLLFLQLQYERYRREIHAERNRRLMGRSRDRRTLEMERDRLREQLQYFAITNKELEQKIDSLMKVAKERDSRYADDIRNLREKYEEELEQNKCLRQANENLQSRLNEELSKQKDANYELEALRGEIFSIRTELEHALVQAEMGLQCKQELARLEAEFIIMGEIQIKCRDRLAELDNYKARDEEQMIFNESYSLELKDMKHNLEEKSSQLDSAKHKILELQAQLTNNEKIITEQKRVLKTVKDEYEEKFKALNKKYDVQKTIIMQMEEQIIMSLHKHHPAVNKISPDIDKIDISSSVERNSPLSTSLASSESLSASLRSIELRNLQQMVESKSAEADLSIAAQPSCSGNDTSTSTTAVLGIRALPVSAGAVSGARTVSSSGFGSTAPPTPLSASTSANSMSATSVHANSSSRLFDAKQQQK